MAFVIGLPCVDVKDRACVAECPLDCIYEGARSLYIHPDECFECGACEAVCPVGAVSYVEDLSRSAPGQRPVLHRDPPRARRTTGFSGRCGQGRPAGRGHGAGRGAAAAEPAAAPEAPGRRRQLWLRFPGQHGRSARPELKRGRASGPRFPAYREVPTVSGGSGRSIDASRAGSATAAIPAIRPSTTVNATTDSGVPSGRHATTPGRPPTSTVRPSAGRAEAGARRDVRRAQDHDHAVRGVDRQLARRGRARAATPRSRRRGPPSGTRPPPLAARARPPASATASGPSGGRGWRASCVAAADLPRIRPISSNGTANRSCSTNASRSLGPSDSRTTSSASPTESASADVFLGCGCRRPPRRSSS